MKAKATGWLCVFALSFLTHCGEEKKVMPAQATRWDLTASPWLALWQDAAMTSPGGVTREADGFTLKAGSPMTGNVFPLWENEKLPLTNYRISYEAVRVEGSDFFG